MGIDISANVFYGFTYDEAIDLADLVDDVDFKDNEWEDYYAFKKGVMKPTAPFEQNRELYTQYWNERRKLTSECPVAIDWHGSAYDEEYFYPYIHIKNTGGHADLGEATELKSLDIKPEWNDQIKEFCSVMGIEYKEPKWYLVSNQT